MTAARSVYVNRHPEPVSPDPFERFHLFWDPTLNKFKSTHIGTSRGEDRCLLRLNPVETVEWLLPDWQVLTRLRTEEVLTWRDEGRWTTTALAQPRQKAKMEHLLLARRTAAHDTTPTDINWVMFTLATTSAYPMFRSWGHPPMRRWNFADWEPHERIWAVQFGLRTAALGTTPVTLAENVCLMHEDEPDPDNRKWWDPPHYAHTLSQALAGKTGSGTHHSGTTRKEALADHAPALSMARTMFALGAVRDYDAVIEPWQSPAR